MKKMIKKKKSKSNFLNILTHVREIIFKIEYVNPQN